MTPLHFLRIVFVLLPLLAGKNAMANMASPMIEGTQAGSPLISNYVDIIREKIRITPDEQFLTALFEIEYHIRVEKSGLQIPLLFYASDYLNAFRVQIDSQEITLSQVPEPIQNWKGTNFQDFNYIFEGKGGSETSGIHLDESATRGYYVPLNDLKYFEVDLTVGEHVIRVAYVAGRWSDRRDWVKTHSFRYVLSPAKYWKSFGELEIALDASQFSGNLSSNIGEPASGDINSTCVWKFESLPSDVFEIRYTAPVPPLAKTLLAISPTGLAAILGFLLFTLHLLILWWYRTKFPGKKHRWLLIAGVIVVPFCILIGYNFSFEMIDAAIGAEAGRYHGYTFLSILFYPILLAIYWVLMWLLLRFQTRPGA